jgi:hypothetical protein
METIVYILKAIVYLYLGYGIGHNIATLKDGAKVYLIRDGKRLKEITGAGMALFIFITTFLWPLYYNMKFRKTFMISARWQ